MVTHHFTGPLTIFLQELLEVVPTENDDDEEEEEEEESRNNMTESYKPYQL